MENTTTAGTLYLVPTPLGNLKDVTYRAIEVLQNVDFILCEDTRTSQKFLSHYGIQKPLSPYHQHNEHKVSAHLADQLLAGKNIALITDAGTPGISDPAHGLVQACIGAGVRIETLPGATAFVPALVNSGLATDAFCFEGFLPLKKGRHTALTALATEKRTLIFYESPHRLLRTLTDLIEYFGADRKACVSRELTKMFEENRRGSLQQLLAHYTAKPAKGEIVLVIAGSDLKPGKDRMRDEDGVGSEDL